MADFSEIPKGVARKIAADHLEDLEDLESFRLVCSLWRSETKGIDYTNFRPSKNTQLPWLILADSPTNSYRRFYSLSKHMFLKIDLPRFDDDADDHRRYFSSKGWLIGVSRKQALITFFDPFSGDVVKPPNVPILDFWEGDAWDDEFYLYQFSKFVFSSTSSRRPSSSSPCEDFQVAMIFNAHKHIAFWRPGQQRWIEPVTDFKVRQIEDVCFFRGEFYSIDHYSQVIAFGNKSRIVVNLASQGLVSYVPYKYYIVVLGSTLLVIHRKVQHDDEIDDMYWTKSFLLFEVNVDNGKARKVKDIGNRALFVGHSSTFFVEASSSISCKRGCRPNCIYFTDDNAEWYCPQNSPHHGGGIDMGIYSLEENKVVDRVYEGPSQFCYETPPLWVELPHY